MYPLFTASPIDRHDDQSYDGSLYYEKVFTTGISTTHLSPCCLRSTCCVSARRNNLSHNLIHGGPMDGMCSSQITVRSK